MGLVGARAPRPAPRAQPAVTTAHGAPEEQARKQLDDVCFVGHLTAADPEDDEFHGADLVPHLKTVAAVQWTILDTWLAGMVELVAANADLVLIWG